MSHYNPTLPERPWEVIGADLFSLETSTFLITVSYYSGFWEIDQLQGLGTTPVIRCLKRHFARSGIPAKWCNRQRTPVRVKSRFEQFAKEWGFDLKTSSPEFPQSNGKAESAVKIAKSLIRKAWAGKEDPWLAILEHPRLNSREHHMAPRQNSASWADAQGRCYPPGQINYCQESTILETMPA